MEVRPEFEAIKKSLIEMTDQYEKACEMVVGKDNEYVDFHARRLVEMAAHIIMSYLLLRDTQTCGDFEKSARIYAAKAAAWNAERYNYIANFNEEDMKLFA